MRGEQHPYLNIVGARVSRAAAVWFEQKLAGLNAENFGPAFAAAGRRLGDARVELTEAERALLGEASLVLPQGWSVSAVGRSLLVLSQCSRTPEERQPAWLEQLYQKGDNREREAVLKTLALLPEPERFVDTAIDACRSHVQSVFEAIACENPYPASYFPEHAFNQLVLKALFTSVKLERVVGLERRRTAELSRMARAYASERQAAGRAVPPDLDLAVLDNT